MNGAEPRPGETANPATAAARMWPSSDGLFVAGLVALLGTYIVLIVGLLCALGTFTTLSHIRTALATEEIRFALRLSLISCTLSTLLSLWVAIPGGYFLVMGLALLILFQTPLVRAVERFVPVTFAAPSIVLAQFTVACAFAIRTMRVTFDQINPRAEQVALTLGCGRSQAFWMVALPEARRGVLTAATLAWARSLGEFGPILIFSGATRMRTEVLPTSIFLELSIGNIEAAAAVSLTMVVTAMVVLILARVFGLRGSGLL